MHYSLYLDDSRFPFDDALNKNWIIARNSEQFKKTINTFGMPQLVSLDYDINDITFTGLDAIKYLCSLDMENHSTSKYSFHTDFHVLTHGNNKIANEQIICYFKNYTKFKEIKKAELKDFISIAFI